MEPEGALLFSYEFATGPYPKPDESRLYHPSYLSKIHFNIILPPTFKSSWRIFFFRLPNWNLLRISYLSHPC
jgi:hypothetical protein